MLASLFERCLKRRGIKESDPYDWEKSEQVKTNTSQNGTQNQGNLTQMTSNASRTDFINKKNIAEQHVIPAKPFIEKSSTLTAEIKKKNELSPPQTTQLFKVQKTPSDTTITLPKTQISQNWPTAPQLILCSNRRSASQIDAHPRDSTQIKKSGKIRVPSNWGSTQRLSVLRASGAKTIGEEHSVTQYAVIDDDNVSVVGKGGGAAVTLASQWKSQFDDSEETDNEWKGENQSLNQKDKTSGISVSQPNLIIEVLIDKHTSADAIAPSTESAKVKELNQYQKKKRCLNISGIENYKNIEFLPRCWSVPVLGAYVRSDLEPPLIQQAAFDKMVNKFKLTKTVFNKTVS